MLHCRRGFQLRLGIGDGRGALRRHEQSWADGVVGVRAHADAVLCQAVDQRVDLVVQAHQELGLFDQEVGGVVA